LPPPAILFIVGGVKVSPIVTILLAGLALVSRVPAETFRVAAYNVENYLDVPTESRREIKSAAARAKVRESIRAAQPDVLALEEMGSTNALRELQTSLRAEGLDLPFSEWVQGYDTNIHVCVLSRLPIRARRPHPDERFLLDGVAHCVSRGFAEVDLTAGTNGSFTFTLIAAHLKSRRPVPEADEADLRLEEARRLRALIETRLHADPQARLVVLGDFNDTPNTPPIRTLMGRGKFRLVDTRPAERNGDTPPATRTRTAPRAVAWTHFYAVDDTYSRIDYILLSPAMSEHWVRSDTFIPTVPNWGVGSDHRPVVATFSTDRAESP
jgi:endonuclease/exonuclease/phosphatase family metal-dependent hydrolase